MNADMLQMLIPIVAILATFGCPVALVFVFKWAKLRDRELTLDTELRKDANAALEARVQRLESILLQLEPHLRPPQSSLMEPPPAERQDEHAGDLLPLMRKDRNA
jgi:hypothetical protein